MTVAARIAWLAAAAVLRPSLTAYVAVERRLRTRGGGQSARLPYDA